MIEQLLNWITCFMQAWRGDGYGEPDQSTGDTTAIPVGWLKICATPGTPAIIFLRNMGANEIEIAARESPDTPHGFSLAPVVGATPGGHAAIDAFKGSVYARSPAGASSLNWYMLVRNKS